MRKRRSRAPAGWAAVALAALAMVTAACGSSSGGGSAGSGSSASAAASPTAGSSSTALKTAKIGVITRSDGSKQATYDGHPLYTYVGDTAPGQAKGNGLNLSGGVWHEMTASGASSG